VRVGIDCRYVLDKPTGIGSYTVGLVRDLLTVGPEHEYVLIVRDEPPQILQKIAGRRATFAQCPLPPIGLRQKREAQKYLRPLKLDVYHYPHHDLPLGLESRSIVTLHHFISFRVSTGPSLAGRIALLASVAWATWRARKVIAVSQFTADLVRRRLFVGAKKVVAIYPPPSPAMETSGAVGILPEELMPGRYFLCVAEWRPHKNLGRLVQAFAKAKSAMPSDWKLVIAGAPYKNYREPERVVKDLGMEQHVLLLGKVDPQNLRRLYQEAGGFVLISLLENFGYPVVEAFQFGLPVVCSRVGSLPEVAGDAALLVNPRNVDEVANALVRLTSDEDVRRDLRQRARLQAERFKGLTAARKTLALYEEVASCA